MRETVTLIRVDVNGLKGSRCKGKKEGKRQFDSDEGVQWLESVMVDER